MIAFVAGLMVCTTTLPSRATPTTSPTGAVVPLTSSDAEAWLDGIVPALLDQGELPGASISIVKDGQVLTARGYGAADRPNRFHAGATPVDPDRHLFRIGSTSKLFTAVAAMQLVEQGRLDLDADIQQYLDFSIDTPKGRVTARHLMTHTAGFEEYMGKGFIAPTPDQMVPLDRAVRDVPRQIYVPGTTTAYSNYGVAVLGYLVQRISGEAYADYVDAHILKPLGMTHTTAAQPLPAHLAGDMAGGFVNQTEPAQPFEHISTAPAGSISSTATDMARFTRFALGLEPHILKPETLQQMMRPALTPASGSAAAAPETMGLQFWLGSRNGVRMVNHGGDTNLFHTTWMAFPDNNIGLFISSNGNGNGDVDIRHHIVNGFVDRYLAVPTPAGPAVGTAKEDARAVAGTYALSRRQESGVLKVTAPLGQMTFTAADDGTLRGAGMTLRETAPNTWTVVDGRNPMFTQGAADGETLAMVPAHTFVRVPWWEHQYLVAGLAIFWLIASFGALAAGIRGAGARRRAALAGTATVVSRATLWARRVTPWAVFAPLALVAVVLFLQGMTNLAPVDGLMHVAHAFIVLAAIAGVAAAVRTVTALRGGDGWRPVAGNGIVAVAMVVFVAQCVQFNLLDVAVRY